jgi:hypothetical protein
MSVVKKIGFRDCLGVFNLKETKSMLELTLQERELYKMCESIMTGATPVVDAEVLSLNTLISAVKFLKANNFKFLILS